MHGIIGMASRKSAGARPPTIGRIKDTLDKAERRGFTFMHEGRLVTAQATGATILKLRQNPIAQLLHESAEWERRVRGARKPVDGEKFGGHELEAAKEIEAAFFAISGALMVKPPSWERVDRAKAPDWPPALAHKIARYQAWAKHWSGMANRFDPTLEIVIAGVIDQRSIRAIAADKGFHHDRIRKAIVRGLRDYAARAGWVSPRMAAEWKVHAATTFRRSPIKQLKQQGG